VRHHERVPDRDEPITLSWTPRPAELADAHLARSREVGSSVARGACGVLLAALGALMLGSSTTMVLAVMLFVLAFLLAWIPVTATVMRRRWGLLAAGNPSLVEPVEARLDDSGVRTDGERMSIARRWSAYSSWSDTPGAVVLATSDTASAAVLVVPHRAASGPEELAAVRALAEQHLGPPLGSGPGRSGRRWWPWVARAAVLALLVVPVTVTMTNVHDETGEWGLWAAEAPLLLSYDGHDFRRTGGPTSRPEGAAGVAFTSGGGLILVSYLTPEGPLTEVWVRDHDNVVRHYVATAPVNAA